MSWILFGGCGGERLPNLTGVSAAIDGSTLLNIRFHYDSGRLQELRFRTFRCMSRFDHFPIDGKGGERIIALAAGGVGCQGESKFAFEIATNRGRSFHFGVEPPQSGVLKHLSIAHGTTIVGLFICQVCEIVCSRSSAKC
jgi:hypothetical protein